MNSPLCSVRTGPNAKGAIFDVACLPDCIKRLSEAGTVLAEQLIAFSLLGRLMGWHMVM